VAAWVVVSGLLYLGLRGLTKVLGEKQYLPEIPTSDAAPLVDSLRRHGLTIGTAESCTGGLMAALLTELPDAGTFFRGSIVAYTDELKGDLLGVPAGVLERDGAVSETAAVAMACGVRRTTGADVGVGITGLTGRPAEGKPPGLTYVAVALSDTVTRVRRLSEDRGPGRNQEHAIRAALALARTVVDSEAGAGGNGSHGSQ
jgi:PncC family amidohydrolase